LPITNSNGDRSQALGSPDPSRWAGGALRGALLWPLNLLRDFPKRAGRLWGAIRGDQGSALSSRLHALGAAFLDLIGLPEILQFLMRLATKSRPLAPHEVAAVSMVLGPDAVRYGDTRIAHGGYLDLVFSRNKGRAFATWHTVNIPLDDRHRLSLLVHELTHVYQYERVGSVYIGQGLGVQRKLGSNAYKYGGKRGLIADKAAGKRYCDYNREQQCEIAQDYFAAVGAGRDTSAHQPFIDELRAGAL